ncbi:peptide-methionine (S)-S-oxide reductase MsrA [Pseudovibrio exalbescens]|uniref:peptide-methionine (S)-S-oxide reductase MsrA n=1 Tax=Pseudovibrio exalbescens TaxID=197461 RepID=UPI000C9B3256|nr:peptide-methionine (S)-S-oxide reductase MsrA [Pseudovibrio exalbescens]
MSFMTLLANRFSKQTAEGSLPGRDTPLTSPGNHQVSGIPINGPYPEGLRELVVGMGCFWGAERLFWPLPGVHVTGVGYAGGTTPNPTYNEVSTGRTGHTEVVKIVFDPAHLPLTDLLKVFWENHDPTQGMRQGNDIGSQYRSAVYVMDEDQLTAAEESLILFQKALRSESIKRTITTEVKMAHNFYWAEDYHQQYLAKHPEGYCGLKGIGVAFPG